MVLLRIGRTAIKAFGRLFWSTLYASFLVFASSEPGDAAVLTAKSPSLTDVTAAVNSASDGDIVMIPAGSAGWAGMLTITKNITIQGAGSGLTTITDNLARVTGVNNLIKFSVTKDLPFGLRGVTITNGSETGASTSGIVAVFGGTSGTASPSIPGISTQLRITDVNFNYPSTEDATPIRITDAIGVVDHCTFTTMTSFLTVYHPSWMGGDNGHGSWADNPTWGSSRFLYVEDCTINVTDTVARPSDSNNGARYVVRYCTLNNAGITGHGSEGAGRGTKQIEIYNNTFTITLPTTQFPQFRGGSVLMHDNVLNGYTSASVFETYRFFDIKIHWGGVTGTNGYDLNAADGPLGGSLYETGTHTGPNNSTVLIDSTKNWTSGQWAADGFAYVITNTSRTLNPSYVTSVSSTHQINFYVSTLANTLPPLTFNTGDSYEIRKVVKAFDQPGQGKGDLKSGLDYLPAVWPNTVLEPCYSWNNWTNPAHTGQLDFNNLTRTLKEGRDYYNRTVKPGYTPYTYPHPLTLDGGGTPPGAPSDLHIVQ